MCAWKRVEAAPGQSMGQQEPMRAEPQGNQNPFSQYYEKFRYNHPNISGALEGATEFGAGALEGVGNMGISLANLAMKADPAYSASGLLGKEERIPHLDFSEYLADPGSIARTAGNFLAPVPPFLKALKYGREIARPKGYLGVASDALRGAGTGYALGEDSEGDRGLSAGLGAVLGGALGSTNKSIGKRFEEDGRKLKKEIGKMYESIFSDAAKEGIERVSKPSINVGFLKYTPEKTRESIVKYLQNPTLRHAHDARKDLGRIERKFKKDFDSGSLTTQEIKAWDAAKEAQSKIDESIIGEFNNFGRPDLAEKFLKANERYATEYIPYTTKESKALTKKFLGNGKHETFIESNYPEIEGKRKFIDSLKRLGVIGAAGGLGVGAYKGYDIFTGKKSLLGDD